jgi:hypothetical protein
MENSILRPLLAPGNPYHQVQGSWKPSWGRHWLAHQSGIDEIEAITKVAEHLETDGSRGLLTALIHYNLWGEKGTLGWPQFKILAQM